MANFSDIFLEKYDLYHKQFTPQIEVNWDSNNGSSSSKDYLRIKTDNLVIRNVSYIDTDLLQEKLWADPKVMEYYGERRPRDLTETQKRIDMFVQRWQSKNPFSCFVIKDHHNNLVGASILDGAYEANTAYLSYISSTEFHGTGYGTEYVGAIVFGLSKYLVDNQYKLCDGSEFRNITATSHPDNKASNKILQKFGFNITHTGEKYGDSRNFYMLPILSPNKE